MNNQLLDASQALKHNMITSDRHKRCILGVLIFIMPICGLSIDVYAPFLPKITKLFNATEFLGKLSISIYILGFGLGQILFGYFSDKNGRKKTLSLALILFSVISLITAFSSSINYFLIVRLIQGISVSGLIINVRSIIVDIFDGIALRKASIYITAAWTVSPIIGPAIGGYFYVHFNWQATFYFLSMYACLALILTRFFINETHHNSIKYSLKQTINNYKIIFFSREFMRNVYGLVIGFSIINLFNVVGPYLIENQLKYSPLFYSYVALIMGGACFLGSLFNSLLIRILSVDSIIKISLIIVTFFGVIGVILSHYYLENILIVVLFCALFMFFIGIVYPNYSINCSNLFKHIAGTAAATRGITTMVGASMTTGIISLLHIRTAADFLIIYPILTAISLSIYCLASKNSGY